MSTQHCVQIKKKSAETQLRLYVFTTDHISIDLFNFSFKKMFWLHFRGIIWFYFARRLVGPNANKWFYSWNCIWSNIFSVLQFKQNIRGKKIIELTLYCVGSQRHRKKAEFKQLHVFCQPLFYLFVKFWFSIYSLTICFFGL